jgi:putative hydrolase of the HAD superfamily
MRVIVFDLDDTLFDSMQFVESGMRTVSDYLFREHGFDQNETFKELMELLRLERNHVFDRFLRKHALYSKRRVQKLLQVYRSHEPHIHLEKEAIDCLKALSAHPLYVVTDGNQRVQKKKYEALGLSKWIKRCFCTYSFGLKHSKPSTYCFEKICALENVSPSEVVYIGDNPQKDFVGLKAKGFRTIRLLSGPYRDLKVASNHEAEASIQHLHELPLMLSRGR